MRFRYKFIASVAFFVAANAVAQVQSSPTPQPQRIVVAGEVQQPGVYALNPSRPSTLSAAVAQGGGVTVNASDTAFIYREDSSGVVRQIQVSVRDILSGKQPDVTLRARDVLYIPSSTATH